MSPLSIRFYLACVLCTFCSGVLAQQKPLKVFVLVGQSNMQGHADVRTLEHLAMGDASKSMLADIVDSKDQPKTFDDVRISYLSNGGVKTGNLTIGYGANDQKIGPELTFGIYMQKRLGEPILIIKAAWGGKSLNTDFRPPSAGPYAFDEAALERLQKQKKDVVKIKLDKAKATGVFYRKTIEHVKSTLADIENVVPNYDAAQGYELAGLVWFQGWNDMVDGGTYPKRNEANGYIKYSEVMTHFVRDIRQELDSPKLPFVIGVMGVGGPTAKYSKSQQRYKTTHQGFRDAMAQPASLKEFEGNVVAVLTENCWDLELDSLVRREGELRGLVKRLIKNNKFDELANLVNSENDKFDLDAEKQRLLKIMDQRDFQKNVIQRVFESKFSGKELEILNKGKSNAAYHYLGSAKIMTCIGKAFADAMPLKEQE